jgi:BTB/POZ domain
MTDVVHFNVGGKRFPVPCSLLLRHPKTVLTLMADQQLNSNSEKEVILTGDSVRFKCVLAYLRGNGFVYIPMTVAMEEFFADLARFRIDIVETRKVFHDYSLAAPLLERFREGIRAEINSWGIHCAIVALAKECASMHFQLDGMLEIIVHHNPLPTECSDDMWNALISQLRDGGAGAVGVVRKNCSGYLRKVGLKVISIAVKPEFLDLNVVMKVRSAVSESVTAEDELDVIVSSIREAMCDESI